MTPLSSVPAIKNIMNTAIPPIVADMIIIVAVSPPPGIGSGILVMTDEVGLDVKVGLDVIVLDAVHGQKDLITIDLGLFEFD